MRIAKTLAIAVSLSISAVAVAGMHSNNPVVVTLNGATSAFTGNIGQAYNSANNFEYIQCNIFTTATTALPTLSCEAIDQWTNVGSCTSSHPSLVNAARSIVDSDFIKVAFNDLTGACTGIDVHKGSKHEPKL